jgi:hypothetical protein
MLLAVTEVRVRDEAKLFEPTSDSISDGVRCRFWRRLASPLVEGPIPSPLLTADQKPMMRVGGEVECEDTLAQLAMLSRFG